MIYFTAHTFNCVCHCIRVMFRVLGIYNFEAGHSWFIIIFTILRTIDSIVYEESFNYVCVVDSDGPSTQDCGCCHNWCLHKTLQDSSKTSAQTCFQRWHCFWKESKGSNPFFEGHIKCMAHLFSTPQGSSLPLSLWLIKACLIWIWRRKIS